MSIQPHQPALLLAPMQGVTDPPMRATLAELGVLTACVTEYVRVSQLVPPAASFLKLVPELCSGSLTASNTAVVLQLLGGDPDKLAESALRAVDLGATGIDLNFGCPAPTVNRHDGGASLLREPQRIFDIVRAVRQRVPKHIPVSAKLRLGWEQESDLDDTSAAAADGGAAFLTVHGRLRTDAYRPWARWKPIGRVRQKLKIPIVANGDIFDRTALLQCQQESGCEHFMVGRGAIAAPERLIDMAQALGLAGSSEARRPTLLEMMRRYTVLARAQAPSLAEQFLPGRLKQWSLLAHRHAQASFYDSIKRLKTSDDILACVASATRP